MDIVPIAFWSLICAGAFILGYGAGEVRGYQQGARDAIEDAEIDWFSYGGTDED